MLNVPSVSGAIAPVVKVLNQAEWLIAWVAKNPVSFVLKELGQGQGQAITKVEPAERTEVLALGLVGILE
jgi:hypothetical protein